MFWLVCLICVFIESLTVECKNAKGRHRKERISFNNLPLSKFERSLLLRFFTSTVVITGKRRERPTMARIGMIRAERSKGKRPPSSPP